MRVSPKDLYCTMMELRRRHAEPSALSVHDKVNYQRQRSSKTDWIDWAADASRYLDALSEPHQMAMQVVYWDAEAIPKTATQLILIADDGLEKWHNSLPDDLIKQGTRIAVRVV